MSKTLRNKVLAVGSAFAMTIAGVTGVAAPASAAGEVSIAPTTGSNLATFNTDDFSLTTSVVTAAVNATTLSYAFTDAAQGKWYVKIGDIGNATGATDDDSWTFDGRDSLGAIVDLTTGGGTQASLTAVADGATAKFDDLTDTAGEAFGEFVVDFKALGITSLYVSSIAAAGGSNTLVVSPFEGTVTAETGTKAGGIMLLDAGTAVAGNTAQLDWSDGDVTLDVQAWIDLDSDPDDIEATYASGVKTVTFYDPAGTVAIPSVERFVGADDSINLNDTTTNANLAASISFGKPVNLDQVDLTNWEYKIGYSDDAGFDNISAAAAFATADLVGLKGFAEYDDAGKWYGVLDNAGTAITLDDTKDYVLSVSNTDASGIWYGSTAFVPASNASDADQVEAVVTDAVNGVQADADDLTVDLRAGTKAFTYKAQIKTADAVKKEAASIQVLALVQAGAYLSTGSTISVSGSATAITKPSQAVMVTGFSNSDGNYSVTVTSSTAAASEAYTVTFYVLDGATDAWSKVNDAGTTAAYTSTYANATATTLTMDSSVVSGASVVVSGTVTDQFGVGTNMSGTKAVSVQLQSSNTTSVDADAVVAADGSVSFTFDNYVVSGASDVLTATTYTGSASSPTLLSGALVKTVQLYNPAAATAVQVPATLTTDVTYVDFLADGKKASATNPAPDNGVVLTGTVVDSNGSGVPAASVTIAGEGLQFLSGTKYYNDSVTVAASAAGVYTVTVFSHVLNSTGVAVTSTTSDGQTATTTLKTYLPATGVTGNNLSFKLNMPANVVKNTTYAVVAELTDKWGNPIQTQDKNAKSALSIQGVGSVQINSVDAATTKNFGKDGKTTVFLRSIKDIAGPGSVTATLQVGGYAATSVATATDLTIAEITTDVTTTAWDETVFCKLNLRKC